MARDRPHGNVVDSDVTKTRGEAASAVMVLSAGLPRTDPADVEQVAASRAAREMWMTLRAAAPILSSTLERWAASLRGTVTAEEAVTVPSHGSPEIDTKEST